MLDKNMVLPLKHFQIVTVVKNRFSNKSSAFYNFKENYDEVDVVEELMKR